MNMQIFLPGRSVHDCSVKTGSKQAAVAEFYLCAHDETNEEGDYRHAQNQQLSAVASPEGLWVHVHHSCHQTLHTHKLQQKQDLYFYVKGKQVKISSITSSPFFISICLLADFTKSSNLYIYF